ncbi:MAG TPA: ATP synthase F1 subunit delta [Candidatus Xenobia bacterium]|jgi:F-type H+-transporting ATPase subunit delta
MVHEAVAQRYASALFELGQSQGDPAVLQKELNAVDTSLTLHPQLSLALRAPNVPDTVKKRILRDLFSKQSPWVLNFLSLLVDKKREAYVSEIVRQYGKLLEASQGIIDAEVETAVPMSDKVKATFKVALIEKTGKNVKTSWKVNPDLLGGYVLRIGDRLLDNSLSSRLSGMQRALEGSGATWKKPT